MTTQPSSLPTTHLEEDLETASVSGGLVAIGTLTYYLVEPMASTALSASVFFLVMLSLGTFTFSMVNMALDRREEFSVWLSQASWSVYSAQAGVAVLLGLGVLGLAQNHMLSASMNELAITVVYVTMIGVMIWFAQESLPVSDV